MSVSLGQSGDEQGGLVGLGSGMTRSRRIVGVSRASGCLFDIELSELIVRLHIALGTGFEKQVVIICGTPNVIRWMLLGQVACGAGHLKVPCHKRASLNLNLVLTDVDQIEIRDIKEGPRGAAMVR